MSLKIGLVSDVHATPAPLNEALTLFQEQGVESVWCAGDIAGYGDELDAAVQLLVDNNCQSILGNHEIWQLDDAVGEEETLAQTYFKTLPPFLDTAIAGKRIYMAHASPPQSYKEGMRLLDERGDIIPTEKDYWTERLLDFNFDVLVIGHTHQVFAVRLGRTLAINPGSTKFNHTCAILSLPEMAVQWFSLSKQTPVKVWNWGISLMNSM